MRTIDDIEREKVEEVFTRILSAEALTLSPKSVNIYEGQDTDFTEMNIFFTEKNKIDKNVEIKNINGKGFIDCLFQGLHDYYCLEFKSLNNIKLSNFIVTPKFKKTTNGLGTDAKAKVTLEVDVKNRGLVEFENQSRSLVYSSFLCSLRVFEFYINCEKSFLRLQKILINAKERNRADILEKCKFDLSKITKMNNYEKR